MIQPKGYNDFCVPLVIILCSILYTPLNAQAEESHNQEPRFLVHQGLLEISPTFGTPISVKNMPNDNLGLPQTGPAFGVIVEYWLYEDVAIGATAIKHVFGKPNVNVLVLSALGFNLTFTEFSGHLKFPLSRQKNATAYLKAVSGIIKVDAYIGNLNRETSTNAFGAGGFGVQFHGDGRIGAFFESLFYAVGREDATTYFIGARGGLTYSFK